MNKRAETKRLPKPLTPPDCDLRSLPWMPLHTQRLMQSDTWLRCQAQPELGFYVMNLWIAAWGQVPAASLPDDDQLLCGHARCSAVAWPATRDVALRGWVRCSDGRLYHPFLAEEALATFARRSHWKQRMNAVRAARKAKSNALETAPNETPLDQRSSSATEPATALPHKTAQRRRTTVHKLDRDRDRDRDRDIVSREEPNRSDNPEMLGAREDARRAKGSRLPDPWPLTEERAAAAAAARARVSLPMIDIAVEHARFTSYWHAQSGARALKRDWSQAWINWCLKANAPPQRRANPPPGTTWTKTMASG